jgi:hypothetical protein
VPAVLHRSRADWPVVLASWLLLTCALSLLAAGTLYTEAVTLAGLHRELRESPAADRGVIVRTKILPDRLAAADEAVVPELDALLAPTGGTVVRVSQSSPYADAAGDPETIDQLTVFAAYDGIEDHAALVAGAWATPGRAPVEATLSEPAAALLGVGVGDGLRLRSRLDASRVVDVRVSGVWAADPADEWWMGEPLALTGTQTGGSFTTRGPLAVTREDLVTGPLAEPLNAEWRAVPLVDGFTPESLAVVADLATGIDGRINAALPFTNQAQVLTKLPAILASVDRSVLVTQSGILLLLVQFGVLAAYAVILVAALLLERRRTETALLRARGGGFGHLVAMAFGEALLVTIPAALAAPWAATLLVQAVRLNPALDGVGLEAPLPGPSTVAVTILGAVAALLALTVPTLASSAPIAGVRAAVGRQVGRTMAQRLGLDLALVVLAVIALVQLRLYGAPITRTARGALGVDPLLVAAPAIGLLAGAVLAVRIVPRLAELMERLLVRGRRLVPALAGRQVARRPLRYTRAALLLILASALGTFASAHAATWTRSQGDQASYAAGADIRLTPDPRGSVPGWGLGEALRAVPGVTAATPVEKASIQLGTTLRDGVLLGIDGTALANLVRVRDDADGAATVEALAALGATRSDPPGVPIPAGSKRLSLVVDSAFEPLEGYEPLPADSPGITFAVVVLDADGRIARLPGETGPVSVDDVRLVVPLTGPDGAAIASPASLVGIQLDVAAGGNLEVASRGHVDVRSLEASPADDGDSWTPVRIEGGRSVIAQNGGQQEVDAPGPLPERVEIPSLFGTDTVTYRRALTADAPAPAPILVNGAFLDRTGAIVGDTLEARVFGVPFGVRVLGAIDGFPTLDPGKPFALVDVQAIGLLRLMAQVASGEASEWWLATDAGGSAAVAASLAAAPIEAERVVDRTAVEVGLAEDPLGLGVIGILGLGSLAALVFAAIGYLVSVSVSTDERLGELALLKALGLAPRQLVVWLSLENVALLVVGLAAGVGLGLVLAWLALPFATLTSSGETPVPAPEVVVPVASLVPTLALGVVLAIATVVLVRRQLPGARTSAVLRARDE